MMRLRHVPSDTEQTPVVLINYGAGNEVHFSGYRPALLAEHVTITNKQGA